VRGVTSEVIAEVRARASILDVVSELVVLKRAGKNYMGLCPFHNEKSPSFTVNQEKGFFKCFGCNEGGDVFAFVQKTKKVEFIDSVRELANKYGIKLVESQEERVEYDKRSGMKMLYEQASQYYQRLLQDPKEGMEGREYLKARGITEETQAKFRLGYAPHYWDGLLNYMTGACQATTGQLLDAGLIRQRQGGSGHFDLFRNRLMVPICDSDGQVIAFGGRTMGDDQVKYINSPESPIYKKGENLFAFNLAKDSIRKNDSVIVVEGYFDAITPHQFGFENTVATLGTALTEAQARLMVRNTESKRVYLAFDTDQAGLKAMERGVETLAQVASGVGIDLRVLRVPGGKDPDECLRTKDENGNATGPEIFKQALASAPELIDYQIEEALRGSDTTSHTGRIEAARKVIPVIATMKNTVARMEYIRQLASRLNIREDAMITDVRQERDARRPQEARFGRFAQNSPNAIGGGGAGKRTMLSGVADAELKLLALCLTSRDDHQKVMEVLADEDFLTPEHQMIKQALVGIGNQFSSMEELQHELMNRLAPEPGLSAYITEVILAAEELKKQNLPLVVVLVDFQARIIKERLTGLIKALAGIEKDEEKAERNQVKIKELTRLEIVDLPAAKTFGELVTLKRRIEAIDTDLSEARV